MLVVIVISVVTAAVVLAGTVPLFASPLDLAAASAHHDQQVDDFVLAVKN
jgi:hypothetical protein